MVPPGIEPDRTVSLLLTMSAGVVIRLSAAMRIADDGGHGHN
jgi:hypothetical protein